MFLWILFTISIIFHFIHISFKSEIKSANSKHFNFTPIPKYKWKQNPRSSSKATKTEKTVWRNSKHYSTENGEFLFFSTIHSKDNSQHFWNRKCITTSKYSCFFSTEKRVDEATEFLSKFQRITTIFAKCTTSKSKFRHSTKLTFIASIKTSTDATTKSKPINSNTNDRHHTTTTTNLHRSNKRNNINAISCFAFSENRKIKGAI